MACDTSILDSVMELREETVLTTSTLNSIDLATFEMQETYKEREPYTTSRKITGTEFVFGDTFLDKVLYAMATDDLDEMNNSELELWNYLVQFEDEFSTSANDSTEPNAIGCTIYDENGNSYVVTNSGVTGTICSINSSELEVILLPKALDSVLVKMLNCEDYYSLNEEDYTLEDISSCSI